MEKETAYIDARDKILKQIREKNLIHVHAPFGMGKSTLIDDAISHLKSDGESNLILDDKYDEFFYSKEEVDSLLSKSNKLSIIEKLDLEKWKIKTMKIIWSVWGFILTLMLAMIPVFQDKDISLWWKLVPTWVSIVLILSTSIYIFVDRKSIKMLKDDNSLNEPNLYIIENVDRNEWDIVIYLFKKCYDASKKSGKKFIFTYSMANLLDRYKEKYNGQVHNLYTLLDKFIELEVNLEKYESTVYPSIIKEIVGTSNINVDPKYIKNFRLLKKAVDFINDSKDVIDFYGLDSTLSFYIYYLSISDNVAYEWLKDNMGKLDNERDGEKYRWWDTFGYSMATSMRERDRNGPKPTIEDIPAELMYSIGILKKIIDIYKMGDDSVSNNLVLHFIEDDSAHTAAEGIAERAKSDVDTYANWIYTNLKLSENIKVLKLKEIYDELSDKMKANVFSKVFGDVENAEKLSSELIKIKTEHLTALEKLRLLMNVDETFGKFTLTFDVRKVSVNDFIFITRYQKSIEKLENLLSDERQLNYYADQISKPILEYVKWARATILLLKKDLRAINGIEDIKKMYFNTWNIFELLIICRSKIQLKDMNVILDLASKDSWTWRTRKYTLSLFFAIFSNRKEEIMEMEDFTLLINSRSSITLKELISSGVIDEHIKKWDDLYNSEIKPFLENNN